MKYEPITLNGRTIDLRRGVYDNGRLAIFAECDGAPYGRATVNLPDAWLTGDRCAFMDTNNSRALVDRIEELGIAEWTFAQACSGYCTYPEFQFDEEWLATVPTM